MDIAKYLQVIQYGPMMSYSEKISEVLRRCGGVPKIARESQSTNEKIEAWRTPYKWPRNGIPEKHWSLIRKLSGVTPEELHEMNEELRRCARKSNRPDGGNSAVA